MFGCVSCTIKKTKKKVHTKERKNNKLSFESEVGRAAFVTLARHGSLALACSKKRLSSIGEETVHTAGLEGGPLQGAALKLAESTLCSCRSETCSSGKA